MIDFYTWTTPNGRKISVMLEECGLEYTIHAVNLQNEEQFKPEFLAIAPNNKIPAIVDHDVPGGPVSVFESGAILVHLAEKSGKFLASDGADRAKTLEWLFWQMGGIGPIMGQAGHFTTQAPEQVPYAIDRFISESARLIKVLDTQLGKTEFMAGDYSIADMATYPWVILGFELIKSAKPDVIGEGENVARWIKTIGERPAVIKGMAVPEVAS